MSSSPVSSVLSSDSSAARLTETVGDDCPSCALPHDLGGRRAERVASNDGLRGSRLGQAPGHEFGAQQRSDTEYLINALAYDDVDVDEASARAAVAFVERCGATVSVPPVDSQTKGVDHRLTRKPD